MITITPTSSPTNRPPVVGNVPAEGGTVFFTTSEPAMAMVGMIIQNRPTTIATAPGYQRLGVATTMIVDGVLTLRAGGIKHISLEVAANNEPAQALYRRFGFAPVAVRKNYYPVTGQDAEQFADLPKSVLAPARSPRATCTGATGGSGAAGT